MAAGASYGLEEGVLQKSLLLLLLQFYVTDNGQSICGSWSESLFLYPIFFLLIFPFFSLHASEESQEGKKLLAIRFV